MDSFAFPIQRMFTPGTISSLVSTTRNTMVDSIWVKLFAHQNIQPKLQEFTCLLTMVDSRLTKMDMQMVSVYQFLIIIQSHGTQYGKSTKSSLVLSLSGLPKNLLLV